MAYPGGFDGVNRLPGRKPRDDVARDLVAYYLRYIFHNMDSLTPSGNA